MPSLNIPLQIRMHQVAVFLSLMFVLLCFFVALVWKRVKNYCFYSLSKWFLNLGLILQTSKHKLQCRLSLFLHGYQRQ